jgi:hypothetical protein
MPHRGDISKPGMIIMWSGLLADVPAGWSICDGTNGTPDLRNRFVRGANASGGSGGQASHTHCHTGSTSSPSTGSIMVDMGCSVYVSPSCHNHSVGSIADTSTGHLPPYYELIFIRKD